jgi:hypothetical protein
MVSSFRLRVEAGAFRRRVAVAFGLDLSIDTQVARHGDDSSVWPA